MKSRPVEAARIEHGPTPFAPDFGDVYHPQVGAPAQARHVFLAGNGLPQRWQGRERFVVLETGFGLGNNFIATWDAWRQDPARCRQLVFASVERHPPTRADLIQAHRGQPLPAQAAALVDAWPPLVPGLHLLDFEGGRVRLLLAFGDVADWLPELALAADAIYLDGFAPDRNPAMWDPFVLKAVGRRAAPGATAATWCATGALRAGLKAAGFEVERAPGIGGKREITRARFAPRGPGPGAPRSAPASVAVVGAGLAGASVAHALAAEGLAVQVLEAGTRAAAQTSGNPGGLFHGIVHPDDGPHARWLRAAALLAQRTIAPRVARGLAGQTSGFLRLAGTGLETLRERIAAQRLPPDWVRALEADEASSLAGVPLREAAWFFPGGGWVSPAGLVHALLEEAAVSLRLNSAVASLARQDGGWTLRDAAGRTLAQAEAVVLANASDALRLLAPLGFTVPFARRRGQVSWWPGFASSLALPLAGDGYALQHPGGLLFGATDAPGDEEAALRVADHETNVERLQRLTGLLRDRGVPWDGRVGWRLQSEDRLPLAGPVPAPTGDTDQARRWPRVEGLYLCTALGGRGITLAPLLGRLLAAQLAGAPLPVEQSLVDAVDPARWRVRARRRAPAVQG